MKFVRNIYLVCFLVFYAFNFETVAVHPYFGDYELGCFDDECDNGKTCSPITNECDCDPVYCRMNCEVWAKDEKLCDVCGCSESCKDSRSCRNDERCDNFTKVCVPQSFEEMKMCWNKGCPCGQRCNLHRNECEVIAENIECQEEECPDPYLCSPVTNRCECTPVLCRMYCKFWAKDEKGCEICKCEELCQNQNCTKDMLCSSVTNRCDCQDFKCPQSYCPHGFETDENECEVCICKKPTCANCGKTTKKPRTIDRLKNWFKKKFGK
uniref:Antistasin-like factor E n=1 Tax=Hirudo verbana TaxID=311461 RepID=A0A7T0KAU1_9ANNE|nr:antistasin-like factor E [Hirudo verbana]